VPSPTSPTISTANDGRWILSLFILGFVVCTSARYHNAGYNFKTSSSRTTFESKQVASRKVDEVGSSATGN
jgi:hypothetical protein